MVLAPEALLTNKWKRAAISATDASVSGHGGLENLEKFAPKNKWPKGI